MRIIIKDNAQECGNYAAAYVVKRVNDFNPTSDRPFVLGLPTGSTPLPMYKRLVQYCNEGVVSFKHVVTFNMDEYVGLPKSHPQSYHHFMMKNFFSKVDMAPEHIHIPDGCASDLVAECLRYEEAIRRYNGIELMIGGLGGDCHIAFNEPGSSLMSRTRVKSLNHETISDNARFFSSEEAVPTMAITMGVRTIMDSRQVLVLATGSHKALAVERVVEGPVTFQHPASALQMHASCVFIMDEAATANLRVKTVRYFKNLASREHQVARRVARRTMSKL